MSSDKIRKLCEYVKETSASNYPIKNVLLEKETDYIKNNYFKMLAVILQQRGEITEAQKSLYARMLAGTTTDYVMNDYFRQALDIEIEDYVGFTEQCKERNLRYRFVLDATLLACCDEKSEEQLELVAHFIDALKITKVELEYLAKLSKSILEQDSLLYWQIDDSRLQNISLEDIEAYTLSYVDDVISLSDDTIHIFFKEKKEYKFSEIKNYYNKIQIDVHKVIFKNVVFYVVEEMSFSDNDQIVFENCEFIGGNYSITFQKINQVIFKNCNFRDFKKRLIIEDEVQNILIQHCSFLNCKYEGHDIGSMSWYSSSWNSLGAIIFTSSLVSNGINTIANCIFTNCGGIGNRYAKDIISNCKVNLKDCEFNHCWNYQKNISGSSLDPKYPERRLFPSGTIHCGCKVIDSADIC